MQCGLLCSPMAKVEPYETVQKEQEDDITVLTLRRSPS